MAIRRTVVTASPAAGGAGVATVSAISDIPIDGLIRAIHLTYLDAPPAATTDVTIAEAYRTPATPILTVTNGATDGWRYPMGQAIDQAAATLTGMGAPIPVNDHVKVTIAQANNADGVTAIIVWETSQ